MQLVHQPHRRLLPERVGRDGIHELVLDRLHDLREELATVDHGGRLTAQAATHQPPAGAERHAENGGNGETATQVHGRDRAGGAHRTEVRRIRLRAGRLGIMC